MEHQDEHITCADCGTTFVFTAAEADRFASKRLDPPKRCFECRSARRAQRSGGRPESPGRGNFGGGVNEYRSPMSNPGAARGRREGEYRAPGFRDQRPAPGQRVDGNRPQGGKPQGGARGEYRAPAFGGDPGRGGGGEYRAPAFNGEGARPRGEYRAPAFGGDPGRGGGGEYRAPSFGGDRGRRGGFRGGPPAGNGFRRDPPQRGGEGGPGPGPAPGPGGAPRGPRGDRDDRAPHGGGERAPRKAHGDRPSYPITCAQCGAASDVPFKPQEGREILCRDCYRARKDAAG